MPRASGAPGAETAICGLTRIWPAANRLPRSPGGFLGRHGTVSVRLDRLEKAGIVTREPHRESGRGSIVQLTERGQHLFDEIAPSRDEWARFCRL